MNERGAGSADRSLDAWLDEPIGPPSDGLRRRVLEDVHRTRQRGALWAVARGGAAPKRRGSLAGALLGVAAVIAIGIGLRSLALQAPGASPSAVPATAGPPFARTFSLPGEPATLGADADAALVALRDGRVVRVRTDGATDVLADLGVEPCGVPLATADAVVVAGCDAQVRRIDGATREVSAFPGAGRQLAAGPDGGVWMLDPMRRSAVLVDGRTGAHRVEVDMRAFVAGAVTGFGRTWIVGEGDARLTALDPATGEILAVVDLGHEPSFGLASADALYAVSANAHVIEVVDPQTGAVVRSIGQLPLLATSMALAPDGLWIAGAGEARLIDPASGSVLRTVPASGTTWVAGEADAGWMVSSGAPELTLLWP